MNRRYNLRPRLGLGRPIKNITFDEPQVKSTETQTSSIQPQNQLQEQNTPEKFVSTIFSVEKELERVKNPIPFSELSKNPSYRHQVSKWIQSSRVDIEGGAISL